MTRFFALILLLASAAGFCAAATPAFPFTFYVHDTTGTVSDTPFNSIYQFAATPLGSGTHVVLKAINTTDAAAFLGYVAVTSSPSSTAADPDFTVSGVAANLAVASGGSLIFTVSFNPTILGPRTGYLQTSYQVQQNGCLFTSTNISTQCPSGLNLSATLTGTATDPQLVLSYDNAGTSTLLQPNGTPLSFGNISTSATSVITFTLSNHATVAVNVPSITVPSPTTFSANPFLLDISRLPATLAPGSFANFTITFEPGQTGLAVTTLVVGSNTFPIQGAGIVIADIDALQISFVDNTGVRGLPQAASPISFGQIVAGSGSSAVLTFTVANPATSYNTVTVPLLLVTGNAFTLGAFTGATTFPASIAPGSSIGFQVRFSPASSGNYSGQLSIGSRVFTLTGLSISSPLPAFSLAVNPTPLNSQQQATVSLRLAAASPLNLTGTIALAFVPSVSGVTDDPAVQFLALAGRTLPISIASGAQNATYNADSAISFQTGTTAGTITFTITFSNTPVFTQSYTITPSIVQVTSATAVRSSPNLVITVTGYDNTYTAGRLNFTFYDLTGKLISPLAVDATGSFQQLFFNNNQAGGAFSVQARFPVTGDVNRVGSVAISVINSAGQANSTQVFQ